MLTSAAVTSPAVANDDVEFQIGDRAAVIKRIRTALKERSGKAWSVTGGRGTAYGWINIQAPTSRHVERSPGGFPCMSKEDCAELGTLLGLDGPTHMQGESIPSGGDYRQEYVDRAEGRVPSKRGVAYWD